MTNFLKTLIPQDIAKGLYLTGQHFMRVFRTANRRKVPLHVVSEYPEVPAKVQPRFRGRLTLLKDEQGEIKCV
jgi:formate hydrogenlyase subunit 6/NADH:ubiquinone oxidoreductase subunit I